MSKIESLKKFRYLSKPQKLGDNILLLATAPCVQDFFDYESVRMQFKDYDLAFINYMITYSEEEAFKYKPKYIILLDSIFYDDNYYGEGKINDKKKSVVAVLEKINWECYLVTSVLADFGIKNQNIKYIRLSCFEKPYKKWVIPFYKKNYVNMGIFNVVQAAIYFAVTFGYKNIAILGCTYQSAERYMREDGLHLYGYAHYYNLEKTHDFIPVDKLRKMNGSFVAKALERGRKSLTCFWNLNRYGELMGAEIINYSEESGIDAFKIGKLQK